MEGAGAGGALSPRGRVVRGGLGRLDPGPRRPPSAGPLRPSRPRREPAPGGVRVVARCDGGGSRGGRRRGRRGPVPPRRRVARRHGRPRVCGPAPRARALAHGVERDAPRRRHREPRTVGTPHRRGRHGRVVGAPDEGALLRRCPHPGNGPLVRGAANERGAGRGPRRGRPCWPGPTSPPSSPG